MSGGFIGKQKPGDHQVVMFTFSGEHTPDLVKHWNDAIYQLKQKFGPKVTGVTMTGHHTPSRLREPHRKPGKPAKRK